MKLIGGLMLGLLGYGAWVLSEPAPGEPDDVASRMNRLKAEWRKAVIQGKAAGEVKREEMEREFEAAVGRRLPETDSPVWVKV